MAVNYYSGVICGVGHIIHVGVTTDNGRPECGLLWYMSMPKPVYTGKREYLTLTHRVGISVCEHLLALKEHATIVLKMRKNPPNSHILFIIEYCNTCIFCLIL